MYYIILFDDGLQLVPDNWLDRAKQICFCPSVKHPKQFDKAVEMKAEVGKQWTQRPVLGILGASALLSGTLRELERSSCEENAVTLACPQGTSISLVTAKYGSDRRHRAALLCPQANSIEPPPPALSCKLPSSLQAEDSTCVDGTPLKENSGPEKQKAYSLLQTVVEGCQKKKNCKLQASPKSFGSDPCPGLPKYVHIVYKCTPYEFRSKTACERETVELKCNPNYRLAIYSASYGRTQYESVQCPQPQGVPEETCLGKYSTETVVGLCHGKRRCTISVEPATFGSPCRKESRMYLKVVYTCVPRRVLKAEVEERPEEAEPGEGGEDGVDYEEEGMAAPNTSGHYNNTAVVNESATSHHNREGIDPTYWPAQGDRIPDKKELVMLYTAVSMGAGLLCVLCIVSAKLAWTRRRRKPDKREGGGAAGETEIPPFTEESSEAEIDLTARVPLALHPSEVVRYGGGGWERSGESGTLRSTDYRCDVTPPCAPHPSSAARTYCF